MVFYTHPRGNTPQKKESEDFTMFTFLDLLVVVSLVLAAATLVSVFLMFLLKNKTAKRVCFFVVCALSLYLSTVGLRIGLGGWFPIQIGVSVLTALTAVGVFVFELISKNNDKHRMIARASSVAVLVVSFANALLF